MNKRPDFGNDLAMLGESVSAEVGDVLQVLQHKRAAKVTANIPSTTRSSNEKSLSAADDATAPRQPASPPPVVRRSPSTSRLRVAPAVDQHEPLENVTTRLRRRTNELLTEAALRQRLKKESPSTRQDIIETALADWFHKHGYSLRPAEETGE